MPVLGISLSTRLFAAAIVKNGDLVTYATKLHKSAWSSVKTDQILQSISPYVKGYPIRKVAVSIAHEYHQTNGYKSILSVLQEYFNKKNIEVAIHPPLSILSLCPIGERRTKRLLMQTLSLRYPELRYFYSKELANKKTYYTKLFEAVAAATLA